MTNRIQRGVATRKGNHPSHLRPSSRVFTSKTLLRSFCEHLATSVKCPMQRAQVMRMTALFGMPR